jgi:hypothetical protein
MVLGEAYLGGCRGDWRKWQKDGVLHDEELLNLNTWQIYYQYQIKGVGVSEACSTHARHDAWRTEFYSEDPQDGRIMLKSTLKVL